MQARDLPRELFVGRIKCFFCSRWRTTGDAADHRDRLDDLDILDRVRHPGRDVLLPAGVPDLRRLLPVPAGMGHRVRQGERPREVPRFLRPALDDYRRLLRPDGAAPRAKRQERPWRDAGGPQAGQGVFRFPGKLPRPAVRSRGEIICHDLNSSRRVCAPTSTLTRDVMRNSNSLTGKKIMKRHVDASLSTLSAPFHDE